MQQKTSASTKNRILSRLSAADMALLKPDLEAVELPLRYVLEVPNKPIHTVISSRYGLASTVAGNRHKRIEVGLIGCDGMTGLPIVLGNDRSPNETFMQVAGDGRRIAAGQAARGYLTKSVARTCASRFRPCVHESDRQHGALEWHWLL